MFCVLVLRIVCEGKPTKEVSLLIDGALEVSKQGHCVACADTAKEQRLTFIAELEFIQVGGALYSSHTTLRTGAWRNNRPLVTMHE